MKNAFSPSVERTAKLNQYLFRTFFSSSKLKRLTNMYKTVPSPSFSGPKFPILDIFYAVQIFLFAKKPLTYRVKEFMLSVFWIMFYE